MAASFTHSAAHCRYSWLFGMVQPFGRAQRANAEKVPCPYSVPVWHADRQGPQLAAGRNSAIPGICLARAALDEAAAIAQGKAMQAKMSLSEKLVSSLTVTVLVAGFASGVFAKATCGAPQDLACVNLVSTGAFALPQTERSRPR